MLLKLLQTQQLHQLLMPSATERQSNTTNSKVCNYKPLSVVRKASNKLCMMKTRLEYNMNETSYKVTLHKFFSLNI